MSSLLIRPLGVEPGISIQLDALKEEYVRNIILAGNVDKRALVRERRKYERGHIQDAVIVV